MSNEHAVERKMKKLRRAFDPLLLLPTLDRLQAGFYIYIDAFGDSSMLNEAFSNMQEYAKEFAKGINDIRRNITRCSEDYDKVPADTLSKYIDEMDECIFTPCTNLGKLVSQMDFTLAKMERDYGESSQHNEIVEEANAIKNIVAMQLEEIRNNLAYMSEKLKCLNPYAALESETEEEQAPYNDIKMQL